jgi:hypothetical protein
MPDTLVLLARMIVQVSASKVSATMTATTHQQQVFSQAWPVLDFKLMPSPFSAKANFSTDIYCSRYLGVPLMSANYLFALTEFRGREGLKRVPVF